MSLEVLIRPFQSRDVLSVQRLVASSRKVTVQKVRIIWGAAGSALPTAVAEVIPTGSIGFKVDINSFLHREKKGSRVTENVNVTNPDDSTQHLTVQRIRSIAFETVDKAKGNVNYFPTVPGSATSNTTAAPSGTDQYQLQATADG